MSDLVSKKTIQAAKSEWDADRKALADKHPDWVMPAWSRAPAWRRHPYMLSAMKVAAEGRALIPIPTA